MNQPESDQDVPVSLRSGGSEGLGSRGLRNSGSNSGQILKADAWIWAALLLVIFSVPMAVLYWVAPDWVGETSLYLELLMLGLACGSTLIRVHRDATREGRLFWGLLASAYLLWITATILLFSTGEASISVATGFVSDLCFLFLYLAVILALELQPHLGSSGLSNRPLLLIEMVAGVVAGFALFVYLVAIPLRLSSVQEWSPSYPFYVLLDTLVLLSLYRTLLGADAPDWRGVYRLLFAAFCILFLIDLFGAALEWGMVPFVDSAFFGMEPLWLAMHVFVVAAARQPVTARPAEGGVLPTTPMDGQETRLRRSSVLLYALVLPVIHFGAHSLGLMDPAFRDLREVTLLGFLLIFGALAILHIQRVEDERSEARESYRRLLDACPVMMVVAEGPGYPARILDCNPLFAATLGSDYRLLLGRSPSDFILPIPSASSGQGETAEAFEAPWEAQLQLGHSAGVPVLVHLRRFEVRRRSVWLLTLVDLSHQKILEERLRQAQRLESLGRLAGGVAHDFNNILTVVEGYSGLLAERLQASPDLLDQAQQIQAAAKRAARLVQQLLAFGRRQFLRPTRTRLNGEVAKFSQVLRRVLRPDIQLVLRLGAVADEVNIDVGQIHDVLLNLVANAQDAIRGAGVVCIETRDVKRTEVENGELAAGRSYVALEVVDSGVGIPAELQEKIFEPFFTTKGPAVASGLGLSSVLGVVEQSGGRITVTSSPGAGATFRILLPLAAGS